MGKLQQYIDGKKGKVIAFIGAGVAHRSLLLLFAKAGAKLRLCDKKSAEDMREIMTELDGFDVEYSLGEGYLDGLCTADVIFRTPGFMSTDPHLTAAAQRGAEITSEVETFFDLCPAKIYAVTGSDGKTTTTSLIADMLKRAGFTVHLGGNIGHALLPMIDSVGEDDRVVCELSSFQLMSMKRSPNVAVVTNLTPNHLDKHTDMAEYVEAKRNLVRYQSNADIAVLGYDSELSREFASGAEGQVSYFSMSQALSGAYLKEEMLTLRSPDGEEVAVLPAVDINIPGRHNVENMLAAFAAVKHEVSPNIMAACAREFAGVEHRIEKVRVFNGVTYYNDSIATSPGRVIAGLKALGTGLIVICGGADKKLSYAPLVPHLLQHAKAVVLMGQTGPVILQEIERYTVGKSPIKLLSANSMEHAVELAASVAKDGDIVTLSPASTSFDSYNNFEERGRHFKQIVEKMR